MVPILNHRLLRVFVALLLIVTILGVCVSVAQSSGERSNFLLEEKSSDTEDSRTDLEIIEIALQNPTNICRVLPVYSLRSLDEMVDAESALLSPHLQRGPPQL